MTRARFHGIRAPERSGHSETKLACRRHTYGFYSKLGIDRDLVYTSSLIT